VAEEVSVSERGVCLQFEARDGHGLFSQPDPTRPTKGGPTQPIVYHSYFHPTKPTTVGIPLNLRDTIRLELPTARNPRDSPETGLWRPESRTG